MLPWGDFFLNCCVLVRYWIIFQKRTKVKQEMGPTGAALGFCRAGLTPGCSLSRGYNAPCHWGVAAFRFAEKQNARGVCVNRLVGPCEKVDMAQTVEKKTTWRDL
ncbi:MAG: hypothetical protein ACI9LD_001316 [Polaromonas sp.]